jgi:nucleotide-binding universal stress UspA family protein
MRYANILVAVDDAPDSTVRLDLACRLSAAMDAALIGLGVGAVPPPPAGAEMGGVLSGDLAAVYREAAEVEISKARAAFSARLADTGLIHSWTGLIDDPTAACVRAAQVADLVILGGRNSRAPIYAPDAADVVISAGRPVLVVPPDPTRSPIGAPALVAWRDCREARRALTASIPLLQLARSVTLFSVCPGEKVDHVERDLAALATYLARHEVIATFARDPRMHISVGRHVIQEAASLGAGLIVAGGYSHARLQQRILGGVTRDLLEHSAICLCLSH